MFTGSRVFKCKYEDLGLESKYEDQAVGVPYL
jgi:hypothetical protein